MVLPPFVCAVCFDESDDGRVLMGCLHSVCAKCAEQSGRRQEPEESFDKDRECPVRQKPPSYQDLVESVDKDETLSWTCDDCEREGSDVGRSGLLWCKGCERTTCTKHAGHHLLSGLGPSSHLIGDLPVRERPDRGVTHCTKHAAPVRFLCKQCQVAMCGYCAAIEHQGHQPIVLMQDMAEELRESLRARGKRMKSSLLPRVELAVSDVEHDMHAVMAEADGARADIRLATKRAIDAIRACEKQQLQEVNRMEQARLSTLQQEERDLREHETILRTAIALVDKLVLDYEAGEKTAESLIVSLDTQTTVLEDVRVQCLRSRRSSRISFETASEGDLAEKAGDIIGGLMQDGASAAHSIIDGEGTKCTLRNESVTFTLVGRDRKGNALTKGGDVVSAAWSDKPPEANELPSVKVKDMGNGSYDISCSTPLVGSYTIEVFVNGRMLAKRLSITCTDHCPWFLFDDKHCHSANTISSDEMTVTHTGQNGVYSSVLGSTGVQDGQHSWKVKVTHSDEYMTVIIGVADKIRLKERNDFFQTYSWQGWNGHKRNEKDTSPSIGAFQVNDILQLDLDSDRHTLKITNHRSADTATICGLPSSELFPYFATCHKNDSLRLVW